MYNFNYLIFIFPIYWKKKKKIKYLIIYYCIDVIEFKNNTFKFDRLISLFINLVNMYLHKRSITSNQIITANL